MTTSVGSIARVKPTTRTVLLAVLAAGFLLLGIVNLARSVFIAGVAYLVCAGVLGLLAAKTNAESGRRH